MTFFPPAPKPRNRQGGLTRKTFEIVKNPDCISLGFANLFIQGEGSGWNVKMNILEFFWLLEMNLFWNRSCMEDCEDEFVFYFPFWVYRQCDCDARYTNKGI